MQLGLRVVSRALKTGFGKDVRMVAMLLGGVVALEAGAQPYAFISAPEGSAVHVVNLADFSLEQSITGLGDEPSDMVLSPDRTRLYLSSWRLQSGGSQIGLIYAIDTRSRLVVAERELGENQARAIALSPDGSVVYAWALSGAEERALVRLDAQDLTVVDSTALPLPDCRNTLYNSMRVHSDGRVFLLGCASGVKWFDPATTLLEDVPGDVWGSELLGFSPDGSELYLADLRTPDNAAQSRLTSLDIATGQDQRFAYAMPLGDPYPQMASYPRRLLWVQRPADPLNEPTPVVLFGPGGALGFAQVFGLASWGELQQAPALGNRRILASEVVGDSAGYSQGPMAATDDGSRLIVTGGSGTRLFDSQTLAPMGNVLNLPGLGNGALVDVEIAPFPPQRIFLNGFES